MFSQALERIKLPRPWFACFREKEFLVIENFIDYAHECRGELVFLGIYLQTKRISIKKIHTYQKVSQTEELVFFLELVAVSSRRRERPRVYRKKCFRRFVSFYEVFGELEPGKDFKRAKVDLLLCAKDIGIRLKKELPWAQICLFDVTGAEIADMCSAILREASVAGFCPEDQQKLCPKQM